MKLPAGVPEPTTGEFGKFTSQMRQMRNDRASIMKAVERLSKADRAMLPDVVPTVDALMGRAVELARTLQQMEVGVNDETLAQLDQRIQALEESGADPETDRRLDLLRRQRTTLAELTGRREQVEAQFESCVLAVQNVRFDLLRLRSAGLSAVLGDITSATQQARALKIDVEAAIEAASAGARVVTVEWDPAVVDIERRNPWSAALFTADAIDRRQGDVAEVIESFGDADFDRILHDPPVLELAGDLYGGAFYRQLRRVLAPRGRLFHYVGNPDSPSGSRVSRGVVRRLEEAGFQDVRLQPDAFGISARV